MVLYFCSSSTPEAEVLRLGTPGKYELHSETLRGGGASERSLQNKL